MLLGKKSDENSTDGSRPSSRPDREVEDFRVLQVAQGKIRKAGLPRPTLQTKNDEPLQPKLDLSLASVDNKTLGKLMAEFTAAAEYASYAHAIADINLTIEEYVLEFVTAKTRLGKSGTVQETKDKTTIDPKVREATATYLEKLAVAKLTASIMNNYERGIMAISREITRRQNELTRT
jgi:hypothetical protein